MAGIEPPLDVAHPALALVTFPNAGPAEDLASELADGESEEANYGSANGRHDNTKPPAVSHDRAHGEHDYEPDERNPAVPSMPMPRSAATLPRTLIVTPPLVHGRL